MTRRLLILTCFLGSASLALLGSYLAMKAAHVPRPLVGLDTITGIQSRLELLTAAPRNANAVQLAFLGDSTAISYPAGRRVPERLEQVWQESVRTPRVQVHSLAVQGFTSFDHYYLADLVSDSKPDQIIIGFNLYFVSQPRNVLTGHSALVAWVSPSRLPDALFLPLYWDRVTADRLLFYVFNRHVLGHETWTFLAREQARVGSARDALEDWMDRSGREQDGETPKQSFLRASRLHNLKKWTVHIDGRPHLSALGARDFLGAVLGGVDTDHPNLVVLGRALRVFEAAGIPTLVYVNPTPIQHLETLGLDYAEGVARTLAALEQVVHDNGAWYLDLHDLLPKEAFRDITGHFTSDDDLDGPLALARALAPVAIAQASELAPNGH